MQDRVAEAGFYEELFQNKPENEHIVDGYEELHDLAFPQPPAGRILDLGCGTGGHSIRLAQRGCQMLAVDLTHAGVRAARERFRKANLDGLFLVADAEHLPLRDGAVEVAWTSLLLHHFPKMDKLSLELTRVASRRIVAFETNAHNLLTWLAFNVVNRFGWWMLPKLTRNQRALWPRQVKALFAPYGFRPEFLEYIDRPWKDQMGFARRVYQSMMAVLPLKYRANKFFVAFERAGA